MLLIVSISIAVGFLDGMRLTMFLPLLEMINGGEVAQSEKLGKLSFIIDGINELGIELDLLYVLVIMLFFFVLKGIARFCEGYYKLLVSQYFIKSMKVKGIDLLSTYNYEDFTSENSGKIQSSLTSEVNAVTRAFANYVTTMQSFMMLLVYVFLAFLANAQFALLITIGGLVSNLAFRFLYKKTKEISRNLTSIQHGYHNLLIQIVNHFKYLTATGRMSSLVSMTKREIDLSLTNGKKIGFYNVLLITIREPIIMVVVVIVILIQVTYMGKDLGLIILSLLFFYRALNFVMNVQTQWNKIMGATGSMENMRDFYEKMANVLNIYLLAKVTGDMLEKGIDMIRRETKYKAALLNHLAESHPNLSPFVEDKRLKSPTVMVANTTMSSNLLIDKLEGKGLVIGNGYGSYKGKQIRIASFPTHSKEQMELLVDTINAINF